MARAKGGFKTRRRHKRVLKKTKGYYAARGKLFISAKETLDRAMAYSFGGRRIRKRDFRALWIARLSAAVRELGMPYSRFIAALTRLKIELDRRVLADLAFNNLKAFSKLVEMAKGDDQVHTARVRAAA